MKNKITPQSVEKEIRKAIIAAYRNPDPEARKNFKALFGDRLPTNKEFIEKVYKKAEKNIKKSRS